MKINHKFFSLPPYISTQWSNVKGLYMRGGLLVINLCCGESIQIPGLSNEIVELVFSAHAAYLEQEEALSETHKSMPLFPSKEQMEMLLQFSASSTDGLTSMMQHNATQKDAPDLPREIIEKIQSIMQIIAPGEVISMSTAEKHCNCPHCQITRAIQGDVMPKQADFEEEIKETDLHFEQWEIMQTGNHLFTVTNKLDASEHFQVYLGTPVGCTCGVEGCEHILAVLKS